MMFVKTEDLKNKIKRKERKILKKINKKWFLF